MNAKKMIALLLAALMMLALPACGGDDPAAPAGDNGTTTAAPQQTTDTPDAATTPAAVTTTTAAPVTTTTKAPDTTAKAPVVTTAPQPLKADTLSDADMKSLRAKMPDKLPSGDSFEIVTRLMCFDDGENAYSVSGNSSGSVKYVSESEGAVFGKAISFAGKADSADSRGEIQVMPMDYPDIEGSKGILFYIDFSGLTPLAEPDKMCASVTINTNNARSQGPDKAAGSAVAYYYLDGKWVETTNITACRLQVPDKFKGWMYVPATAYYQDTDGKFWESGKNTFTFILIENMRCYTDGYQYSADSRLIFDEITFVK